MGALRLALGWLFLAAISAAGAFFGLDEVDRRVGLERFHLHEKFGIAHFESVPRTSPGPVLTPSRTTPSTETSTGPAADTRTVLPPPSGIVVPGPTTGTPGPGPGPGPDTRTTTFPPAGTRLEPSTLTPPTVTPPKRIPDTTRPPASSASDMGPTYSPPPRPRPPETEAPPPPRPRDFDDVKSRFIDVSSRVDAVRRQWAGRQPSVGALRPEIQSALSSMQKFVREADIALHGGDTATARRYLDQAEKQMEILKDFE